MSINQKALNSHETTEERLLATPITTSRRPMVTIRVAMEENETYDR